MDPLAISLLVIALLAAAGDWWAVERGERRLEYVLKPLVLICLIALAAIIDVRSAEQRTWFLVALAFSLLGDVLLMSPRDLFVPGLSAFLAAHLAYIGGFAQDPGPPQAIVLSIVVIGVAAGPLAWRIVTGARARDFKLGVAVGLYVVAITMMGGFALGSGPPLATVGALLFIVSDTLIGLDRFVRSWSRARLAIMVTYHLAQVLLVLSLL